MTPSPDLNLQYIGWLIALFALIFAAYVIYLNPWHKANLLSGAFISLLAVCSFGIGSLAGAAYAQSADIYAALLAAVFPILFPVELITLLAIFRPSYLTSNRWRWVTWTAGIIALVPVLMTVGDTRNNWGLWYSGIPVDYSNGYLPLKAYTQGVLSPVVYIINFALIGGCILAILIFHRLSERQSSREIQRTAWLFLIANMIALIGLTLQIGGKFGGMLAIGTTFIYLMAFGYATLKELISNRSSGGSLRVKLTALALIVAIPMIIGISVFLTEQARRSLTTAANQNLQTANKSVFGTMDQWLDYNSKALQILVSNPDTTTMNSIWQKPLLARMVENYPHMYLVSTVDVNGINKTRSDDQPLETYKDRFWFQNALGGAPVTYEALIGKTSGKPALIVSMPIFREDMSLVGVGMFASELSDVSEIVQDIQIGEGGSAFVVDQRNVLVSHSDPEAPLLANLGGNPAVKALREGKRGAYSYSDVKGERIQAYIDQLPNGWGVITQQTETGLFMPIRQIQQLAFIVLVIGAALMSLLAWTTIRQALLPVEELTETSKAISQGDLTRRIVLAEGAVEAQDELSILGESFNRMTDQLQELINGLEIRVAERTADLERRALQLQVTSEVAREAAAIRDPDRLLGRVARLISERFGYDHTGIFLVEGQTGPDATANRQMQGYAILRAASSEGGEKMLKRGHHLRVGRQGIVGYVAATGKPRIALDVGNDAVFFDNPDLPQTRSEMALPLKIQARVIGVLDVQSNQPAAFTDEDLEILQIMADQVALAIENSRLLQESREIVKELETQYGSQIRKGWVNYSGNKPLVYTFDRTRLVKSTPTSPRSGSEDINSVQHPEIFIPIELRGQQIGGLKLRKEQISRGWSEAEVNLAHETATQLALSLENARLMEEIRSQASHEEMINKIVTQTESSLNLDSVMKKAVLEIGRSMRLSKVQIRLGSDVNEIGKDAAVNPNGARSIEAKQTQEWEE